MMQMNFNYDPAPQLSPEWMKRRQGKISASRLKDWLAVSKAKGKEGEPLKARTDYERELQFARQFGVSYNTFVSSAMEDGIRLEGYVAEQYAILKDVKPQECGCFYSDEFVASPDRLIGEDGLLEIKVVRDATFTDILLNGVPEGHFLQIQGQLLASDRAWCDYVAFNLTTRKLAIHHVERDEEAISKIKDSLTVELSVEPFNEEVLFNTPEPLKSEEFIMVDQGESVQW